MVEGFFAQLTNKAIRRGTFASVPDLIAAIDAYLTAKQHQPHAVHMDQNRRPDRRKGPARTRDTQCNHQLKPVSCHVSVVAGNDIVWPILNRGERVLRRCFVNTIPRSRPTSGRRVPSEAVDDIVSETFLVVWRRLDEVPEPQLPWLG